MADDQGPRDKLLDLSYVLWRPDQWDVADIDAVRAVWNGEAQQHQQRRAIEFLMLRVGALHEMSFSPIDARHSDFMEGRRFIGRMLYKFVNMSADAVAALRAKQGKKPVAQSKEQG